MRLRNVAEVERISSLPARCASWLSGGASEPAGSFRGRYWGWRIGLRSGSLLTVGYTWDGNYEPALFDTHRQIRGLVYTQSSGSNLKSHPTEEVSNGNSGASR